MKSWIKNTLFGGAGAATGLGDFGLFVLRVGTGLLMAFGHGLGKLWADGKIGPPDNFLHGVADLNFPLPTLAAWLAALAEFLGGLFVAAGLMTRPMAFVSAFNMAVAAFYVHAGDPIFRVMADPNAPYKEPALLYLLPFFLLMFTGAGRISLDRYIRGN